MGQIDFNLFQQTMQEQQALRADTTTKERNPYVGFFSLKNDKDQAIVRILVDSISDIKITAIHRLSVNGRNRAINCMRDPIDPVEACPYCNAEKRLEYKVYIPMLEYTKDDQGKIVVSAKIWERPAQFATRLSNLISDYGPLSDNIFRVIRNGEAYSQSTTYDVQYCLPSVYKPELYPKDTSLFENYKVIGSAVLNTTEAEAAQIIQGITPERFQPKNTDREIVRKNSTPDLGYTGSTNTVVTNMGDTPSRPRRYYQ